MRCAFSTNQYYHCYPQDTCYWRKYPIEIENFHLIYLVNTKPLATDKSIMKLEIKKRFQLPK